MSGSEFIDAHVHVWTSDLKSYPLASGSTAAQMQPASFTPAEFLRHAEPCGVGRAVLIQMSFYGFDNSYMLDVIGRNPDRFVGVAVVDENDPQVGRSLVKLRARGVVGLRLVAINCEGNAWIDAKGIQNLLREASARNVAVGFLCDASALAGIGRLCEQYPELTVVIDHMARLGAGGRWDGHQLDSLCNLSRHRGVYVKISAFYALGSKRPPYLDLLPVILRLRDAYGADRLMWASDCPFQVGPGHSYRQSIELIAKWADFLSSDEKHQLLRGTAEQVFFRRATAT